MEPHAKPVEYESVNLENQTDVVSWIREFESRLSAELNMPVSVVAYTPQKEMEDLGHA